MTTTMNQTAKELQALELGQSVVIRDSHHRGVTVVRGRIEWVVIDLENGGCATYDRLRLVESKLDGDDSGLNNISVGCDMDGSLGLWLIPGDAAMDSEVDTVWDSDSQN